jgi:DNA ligase-1
MTNEVKFKPQLAEDYSPEKLKFPVGIMPKLDGVRALNINGKLVGRSLKSHGNLYTTDKFSQVCFDGLDGEMVLGNNPAALNLCSDTSGAITRIKGEPELTWWCFDLVNSETKDLGYFERWSYMTKKVVELQSQGCTNIEYVPLEIVHSLEEYNGFKEYWLQEGFEGVIIRADEKYKQGRSSTKTAGYWRDKGFVDAEILVTGLVEGNTNNNEAKVNELGRTERSSHQENKEPNGQVGSIVGTLVKDLIDPDTKKLLLNRGTICNMAPGAMTQKEREYYLENPQEIVGLYAKGKLFPKGVLDKPRFYTFLSIRAKSDMDLN